MQVRTKIGFWDQKIKGHCRCRTKYREINTVGGISYKPPVEFHEIHAFSGVLDRDELIRF